MKLRRYFIPAAIAMLALGALFYRISLVHGCGPFVNTAFFTYSMHPDLPLEPYAAGNLGIIQPTYARSYLYVAYRYLSGKKFDRDEQKALVAMWKDRLALGALDSKQESVLDLWIKARRKVLAAGPDPSIEAYRDVAGRNFEQYINCTDDSFQTATRTLDQRIAKFGAESKTVGEWLHAQDQVFSNCNGKPPGFNPGSDPPALLQTIPAAIQTTSLSLERADRDYQIAAAYFYSANFDESGKRFEAIARDPQSPWNGLAHLLAARSLIRKATLSTQDDKYDKGPFVQAEKQLNQILGDPKLKDVHPSAQRLVDFIELRLHPQETENRLATRLLQDHVGNTLKQSLTDFTVLLEKGATDEDKANGAGLPSRQSKGSGESPALAAGNDLADWIINFQNNAPSALDYSLKKWTKTRSLPWLVAALTESHAGQPSVPQLLKAAEGVAPGSPAFATVVFHRLRLMSEANQTDEVRTSLDQLLFAQRKNMPLSSLNLFLALRMRVAINLEEFLKFAQRVPATITFDEDGRELPDDADVPEDTAKAREAGQPRFDSDSTEVLNRMVPLELLVQAAQSKVLPDNLRRQVVEAAWVRSVLLGDTNVSAQMTPILAGLELALKSDLEIYRSEKSADAGRFTALFLMLKFPGTRPLVDAGASRETALGAIDNFRDNWWCFSESPATNEPAMVAHPLFPLSRPMGTLYPGGVPGPPPFVNAEQAARGMEEWKKLEQVGVAPNFFVGQVITWGKQHPDDPRVPEALYLVVRSTRYGCTNKETGGLSKAAFQFLHEQYPKSQWAAKTKYWYGGGDDNR